MQKKYDNDDFNIPKDYHNFYLFLWGSGGIAILLIFLIDIYIWVRFLLRNKRDISFFGIAFLICYLTIFAFDSTILAQMDNIFYHFVFCLIPIISIAETRKISGE
jgi:O-antigen ligase